VEFVQFAGKLASLLDRQIARLASSPASSGGQTTAELANQLIAAPDWACQCTAAALKPSDTLLGKLAGRPGRPAGQLGPTN